jgi:hypothetical protein
LERQMSSASVGGGGAASEKQEKLAYPELEQLPAVWGELGSTDWAARMTGLSKLGAWIEKYPAAANLKAVKVFEQLVLRLTDSNRKVNAEALTLLARVLATFRESLPRVITFLLPPLTTNLASNQAPVRTVRHCLLLLAASPRAAPCPTSLPPPLCRAMLCHLVLFCG